MTWKEKILEAWGTSAEKLFERECIFNYDDDRYYRNSLERMIEDGVIPSSEKVARCEQTLTAYEKALKIFKAFRKSEGAASVSKFKTVQRITSHSVYNEQGIMFFPIPIGWTEQTLPAMILKARRIIAHAKIRALKHPLNRQCPID